MKIQEIINKIPGFEKDRSKMFKGIMIICYVFMFILLAGFSQGYTTTDRIIGFIQGISLILPIYLLVSNLFNIRSKLPLLNKRRKTKKYMGILIYSLIILMFSSGVINISSQFLSAEQKQINLARIQETQNNKLDSESQDNVNIYNEKQTKVPSGSISEQINEVITKDFNIDTKVTGKIQVHFIDVGQADSILIKQGDNAMLVDAGNNADSNLVIQYIKEQGIKELDYVIGTHAHEDHIGGIDQVINTFDINKILFPRQTSTTQTFEDFVMSVKNKGMKLYAPNVGETFNLGNATFEVLAPNSTSYSDANDYSIVIKLKYGNNSFLLSGDAESVSEQEMISKGLNLGAVLLKIGHHGSSSSTSQGFLDKVKPKYAVISVGKDNSYGHPTKSTMDKLKNANIQVYRTDENGTIIATSDGNNITFNVKPASYNFANSNTTNNSSNNNLNNTSETNSTLNPIPVITPVPVPITPSQTNDNNSRTVYYTPSGKSYHYTKNCPTLSRSKTILSQTLTEALNSNHSDPCDKCTN